MVRAKIEALRDVEQGIDDSSAPLDRMLERKKVGAQHHVYKEHPRWKFFPQKDRISKVPLESMRTMSLEETGNHWWNAKGSVGS